MRLDDALGHRFTDRSLLETALTHRSYTAEHEGVEHNERLEFLGDAVLGLLVAEMLFRRFPRMREGEMAKVRASLVSREELAAIARTIGLGDHVKMGRGEVLSGGSEKDSILADAMEAVLAAVFLDGGLDAARRVVADHWEDRIMSRSRAPGQKDYKTRLQEILAKLHRRPVYEVVGEGPDHDRTYRATVTIDGVPRGGGVGHSKKEAEQEAARDALERTAG